MIRLPPRSTLTDTLFPDTPLFLSVSALDHLADEVAPNDLRFKFRLIPKATLDRRKKSASRRLTSGEGDRLARIAKVFSFAMDIYKDKAKVREFFGRPHAIDRKSTRLNSSH